MKLEDWTQGATKIDFFDQESWPRLKETLAPKVAAYAAACDFAAKPGQLLLAPGDDGGVEAALFGLESGPRRDPFFPGKLATLLPPGLYRFGEGLADESAGALAFLLSSYGFFRYVEKKGDRPRLCAPQGADRARIERIAQAVALGRDLVNTPANDMGPEALAEAALTLAARHGAQGRSVVGEALLAENFHLIHAVGKGAAQAPRLVEFAHGPADGLKVTLVGKGVCFDTGGLDIKPASGMLLVKKDMGGAATALALAAMLMESEAQVRLRVILPIVENSVSAAAFRPSDVYRSRKGLTVEVVDTDAEGRLVLADALAYAGEDEPDLLVDFATLTGAARVALGPQLPAFFTDDDALAADIAARGAAANDPVWRLPLWAPYAKGLDSKIADIGNVTRDGFAGAIVAALFLRRFVAAPERWAHVDLYAWTPAARPGAPEGGEIQAARLLYDLIEARAKERSA